MRGDTNTQPQASTNGSSHNGNSSPQTNGSSKGSADTNGHGANGHTAVTQVQHDTSPFHGHDREEVTRLLLQSLGDLGYAAAARQLSQDSGYALETPRVASFRAAVLGGEWVEAEALLFGAAESDEGAGVRLGNGHSEGEELWRKGGRVSFGGQAEDAVGGLPLAPGADTTWLRFLLRQQKYLELLEQGDWNAALVVLRGELTPLKRDVARIHALSGLMMCQSASDLRAQADWDGAEGQSRAVLLSDLSRSISSFVMIPEHRLATLLTSVQRDQVAHCRYHNTVAQPSLYTHHECSAADFPLHTLTELRHHTDEVWHLAFSHDGTMLATGGKDGLVCVYDTARWRPRHEFREHERGPTRDCGVCYVAFSPDDRFLISCSKANEFVVLSLRDGRRVAMADHFDYPVTSAAWLPDSQHFVIGTQGSQRPLSLYSLPTSATAPASSALSSALSSPTTTTSRNQELHSFRAPAWNSDLKEASPHAFRITDLAITPRTGSYLAALTLDNRILVYHLPTRALVAEWQMADKLTSVCFAADGGQELLVNMNEGRVIALDALTGVVKRRYEGATQRRFVVRSAYGGADEGVVVSGSEDSRVYLWRRATGAPIAALPAHSPGPVNAVAWHPTDPRVFASAGDDRIVRIWTSTNALRPPSDLDAPTKSSF